MSIAICKSCHRHFDTDDFMDDNLEESEICPDCYYGGGMVEEDDTDIDDCPFDDSDEFGDEEESQDEHDSRIIRSVLGDDVADQDISDDEFEDDLDDYEDRLDAEEGDYE